MFFEARGIGGETVILGGDGNFAGLQILYGLVAAAMAKLEFKRRAANGVGEHLMAEADAEDGVFGQQRRDRLVYIAQRRGVAGAVGKEDRIDLVLAHLLGGGGGGEDLHVETVADKFPENRVLGPKIEGRDLETFGGRGGGVEGGADRQIRGVIIAGVGGGPEVGRLASDVLHVIAAGHVLPGAGPGDGFFVGKRQSAEAALHCAVDAEFLGESAGVDFGETGDAVFGEVGVERGFAAPV